MRVARVEIAKAFAPLFKPKRYKVFYGGRGGAKSWAFAQALLIKGAEAPLRVLCTRELQQSIQESVHKLLSDMIVRMQLDSFYTVQDKRIFAKNGTNFIFEGLKSNTTKIKSMERLDIVWCEEAENISEKSWDLLVPTLRRAGSEIWVSYNPADELDETHQRFVVPYEDKIQRDGYYEDSDIYVAKVGWKDNPWFTDEMRNERDKLKVKNYRKYLHVWEGEPNADYEQSIILPEWVDSAIDAHKKLAFKPRGARIVGFDPADEGSDNKALVYRHGSVVLGIDQWSDGDITDAIDRAFTTAFDLRCNGLVYDGIGVGTAVKVYLRQHDPGNRLEVTNYIASETPRDPHALYDGERKNKDVFKNLRAQWWWELRDRFERTHRAVTKGQYSDSDKLISLSSECKNLRGIKSELVRVQRKRGRDNTMIQIESKDDMIARQIRSPNMADALVMAFANIPIIGRPREQDLVPELTEDY